MSGAPDWLLLLREECARTSQKAVAQRLGYAASTLSSVLKGTYAGDMDSVGKAVRGLLMAERVRCPVLDEIPMHQCMAHQRRPFAATNPLRVQLWQACRAGCPHSRLTETQTRETER